MEEQKKAQHVFRCPIIQLSTKNQVKTKNKLSRPQMSHISLNISEEQKKVFGLIHDIGVYISASARGPQKMVLWASYGPRAIVCPALDSQNLAGLKENWR